MKKLLIILLVFIFCFSANTVLADSFNVKVDTKTANAGDVVDININLENNSGLLAAIFNVEFDKERLELIEVQDGQLLEGGTFSPNYKAYPYKMVWNSASYTDFTDDGVLAVLKFKVLDNAESGTAFINLEYKENDVFNVDLNNVPITVINGGIEVVGNASSDVINQGGNSGTGRKTKSSSVSISVNNDTNGQAIKNSIVLTIGKKEANVFGETKSNDVAPIIRNDRTMLPARFVAENLGATVEWDNDTRTVTITKDDIKIVITIDSQTAFVNGAAIILDSPAFIENDRTYTPLRFIAEKLGAEVDWNGDTQTVYINSK